MEAKEKAVRLMKMFEYIVKKGAWEDYSLRIGLVSTTNFMRGMTRIRAMFGMDNTISDDRYVDFFTYQVYRYRDLIVDSGSGWNESWCLSDKACQKYRDQFISKQGKSGMRYYIKQWMDDCGLCMESLRAMIADPKPNQMRQFVYMPSEEPIKRRFFNTPNGFLLCIAATTGWSPKSEACTKCVSSEKCRYETSMKYPELYRIRTEQN